MGRVCCKCPIAWVDFIGNWVFVQVSNTSESFGGSQWELTDVEETYLVLRRPMGPVGWQYAIVLCTRIVALVEAPPLLVM